MPRNSDTARPDTRASLDAWLDYISQSHPQEIELGLERVRSVFKALNIERKVGQLVLVAGTNGKGSTIAMIERALQGQGLKTGAYTSPHIHHYNERVRVGGKECSDAELIRAFDRVEQARGETPLTYFEFGTLAAMALLMPAGLDVLLLEIGLGGRLDAVNIVEPDLCIITSIGLDHQDWLGDSLEAIGYEKAGILRQGVPALLGDTMSQSVLDRVAALSVSHVRVGESLTWPEGSSIMHGPGIELNLDVLKQLRLPRNNIMLALYACELLIRQLRSASPTPAEWQQMLRELAGLSLPGRLEQVHDAPLVYLDVGHNPQAAVYLADAMRREKHVASCPVIAVYSALADKDVKQVVQALNSVVDHWYVAPLDCARALSGLALEEAVGTVAESMVSCANLPDAMTASLKQAQREGAILLVFGSFYVVEAAKTYFEKL